MNNRTKSVILQSRHDIRCHSSILAKSMQLRMQLWHIIIYMLNWIWIAWFNAKNWMIYSTTKKDGSNRRENNGFMSMAQKPHRKSNQQKSKHQNWNANAIMLHVKYFIPFYREKKERFRAVHQHPATRPTKLHLIEYLLQFFPFAYFSLWRYTEYADCMYPPIQRSPSVDSSLDFRWNINATTSAPFANANAYEAYFKWMFKPFNYWV